MTTTMTPHLALRDAASAVEFYQKAFGAEPVMLLHMPDGKLMHGELSVEGAGFMLGEEYPQQGVSAPAGNSGVTLHLNVPDCDALFERARKAGCEVVMAPEDMFWGDRYGVLLDPYGHRWSIATTQRTLSPEEMQEAAEAFMAAQ